MAVSRLCKSASQPASQLASQRIRYVADLSRFRSFLQKFLFCASWNSNQSYSSDTCAKYAPSGCEFVIFAEHVCKVQPLELRIRCILRTRAQRAATGAPNSSYFSNTCAKCRRLSSEFVVFFEHVCKVLSFELRICCIPRTRAQSAASQQARQIEVLDFRNSGLGSRSFNTLLQLTKC
jgi:hypothetical protein